MKDALKLFKEEKLEISEKDILEALEKAGNIFQKEPNVVKRSFEQLLIVGDLHGFCNSAKFAFDLVSKYLKEKNTGILFLGDYVDRGPVQIEVLYMVLSFKINYPDRVIVLRGNHETDPINRRYGFYRTMAYNYGEDAYDFAEQTFAKMPIAALINDKIFACHGGLPKGLERIEQLDEIDRFVTEPPEGIFLQLLWNDPRDIDTDFAPNWRGEGLYYFGPSAYLRFKKENNLQYMFRAHEAVPSGIVYHFDKSLITVFTAEYPNVTPAVLLLKKDGTFQEFYLNMEK